MNSVATVTVRAAVVVAALVASAAAHGHILDAINGNVDVRTRTNGVNICGVQAQNAFNQFLSGAEKPQVLFRGQSNQMNFRITNGDGAGPVAVTVDKTCTGTQFDTTLRVDVQVPGTNGNFNGQQTLPGDFKFNVTVPAGLQCNCAIPNVCLMRVLNPQDFTSCAFFTPANPAAALPVGVAGGAGTFQQGFGAQQQQQVGQFGGVGTFQQGFGAQQGIQQQGFVGQQGFQQGFAGQQGIQQQGFAGQQGFQQGAVGQQRFQQGVVGQQGFQQGVVGQQAQFGAGTFQQGVVGQQAQFGAGTFQQAGAAGAIAAVAPIAA